MLHSRVVTVFSRVVEGTAADMVVDEELSSFLLTKVFDWVGPE